MRSTKRFRYFRASLPSSRWDNSALMMPAVEFNYKAPVARAGGGIRIAPNFPTDTGPINMALATARNSEVPRLLKKSGELTKEDDSILYYHLQSNEPVYVGKDESDEIFNGVWLNESAIQKLPTAWNNMLKLREMLLKRGEGEYRDRSAFEMILAGRDTRNDSFKSPRCYKIGFTVFPLEPETDMLECGMVEPNKVMIEHQELIVDASRLAAAITTEIVEANAPPEVLKMLARRAAIDVPMMIGSEKNIYSTTCQLNFSDGDEASLEIALGDDGTLHVDVHDDIRQWTTLISLSNNVTGYWPGRTLITSHRIYAVMAPFTVLLCKAANPHLSIRPELMVGSDRAPYLPSVSSVPTLDPEEHISARVTAVNYSNEAIMNRSPLLAREHSSILLQKFETNGELPRSPHALPSALMAFGTRKNQFEWLACATAWEKALLARMNDSYVLPSTIEISRLFRWREAGVTHMPDVQRIQKVLDGNEDTPENRQQDEEDEEFAERCREQLSQGCFEDAET
ncbi:uncharacterized protein LY89DRAFT_369247 [Mollisia scopiformis]|uniref:Uncharacterized protein n=1 Tax=Mollisia scopiformis TaxID=149040 RepID=A0A132B5I6_MOLSC|nr:uncharacterized protein LY89DRAFT_369247 [Mollisia scopiformis]KUJ07154.1 hypothetical protein LY89DRAFT_369247 [Mollisia scopiformis]